MMAKKYRNVAVVDLDGTLSKYDGWKGEDHFGKPVPGAREAMEELRDWGWLIVVYTTRGNDGLIRGWLVENEIPFDAINSSLHNPPSCSSKPIATVYFDDREAHHVGCKWYDWHGAMQNVRRIYQPHEEFVDEWAN